VASVRFQRVAKRLQDIGGFGTVSPQIVKGILPTPKVGGAHLLRLEKGEEPIVYTKAFSADDILASEEAARAGGTGIDGRLDADDLAVRDMTDWVLGNQFETVTDLQKTNFFDVSRGGKMVATVVIDPGKGFGKESRAWRETMLQIARPGGQLADEHREKFFFGVMDGTEEDADTYLEAFGVLKQNLPQLIVFDFNTKDDEHYYFEGLGEHKDALPFIQGVADGTITAQYEGTYGMPDRIWRQMKQYAPFLSALDFLPRFTFTIVTALAVVAFLVKCMCFDDDDWLEGSPQPTSEAVLRQRREREMRKQLAATQAKGRVGEVEAELVKKATENAETPNPAAKKNTEEKKKD